MEPRTRELRQPPGTVGMCSSKCPQSQLQCLAGVKDQPHKMSGQSGASNSKGKENPHDT